MIDLKEFPYYKELFEKGFQIGRKEAATRLVFLCLNKRVGKLDEQTKIRIEQLSLEQTEDLALSIFDFNNLDDVKVWLANKSLGLEK